MSWAVQLEGRFKPYDDVVSNTIEAAHERGESTVIVQIRGQKYIIGFADMKQKLASDTTRQRSIQRKALPAAAPPPPAAVPPPPAAASPPAASAPAAPPAKRKAEAAQKGKPAKKPQVVQDAGAGASGGAPADPPSKELMKAGSNNFRIHTMLIELAETEKVKGENTRPTRTTKQPLPSKLTPRDQVHHLRKGSGERAPGRRQEDSGKD